MMQIRISPMRNSLQKTLLKQRPAYQFLTHNVLKKHKLDKQFTKFMEVFKKLHINILFADALEQMPNYVKFMKDILS